MKQAILFLALVVVAQAAPPVIWSAKEAIAIYESVNIGNSGRNVVVGKGYNDASIAQVELFNVAGQGTPVWAHQGPDYEVAAAKNADLIAGVSYDSTTYHAVVSAWKSGSSEPLWSVPLPIQVALPDGQITIYVTDDGSKILLIVTQLASNPQNINPRLYWFTNVASNRPMVSYADLPQGAGARDMACSSTGQYVAVAAGAYVYVYDTVNKRMRSSINFGFSTVALCMSPDGQYLGHGFTTMYFYQWNANNYTFSGSYVPGQSTLHVTGQCAIAANGVAVVAWTTGNYLQKIISAHTLQAGKVSLTFKYSFNENQNTRVQDLISGIAMSPDGSVFGISSWGDGGSAPTVAIFKTATGSKGPIYTMATTGSMNDIDLYLSGNYIYATAGGKAVHNNIMGDGGYLVTLQVPVAGAPPS